MQLQHHAIKSLLISCLCAVFLAVSGFAAKAESNTASEIQTPSDAESSTAAVVTDPSAWPTLWVVGDSTAAEFADTAYYSPRYGWGTQLGNYFQNIHIRNLAVSGTSSKSFLNTEQYHTLLQEMQAGDYLMIGFGHNDEKAESGRYTNPNEIYSVPGSFQYYLYESYIRPAREREVTPLLVTPIVRRNLGNNYTGESGHITQDQTTVEGTFPGGNYAKSIRQLAVAKSVPLIDLTRRTRDIYEQLNAHGIKNRHAWTSSNEVSIDNTHTNRYGAACNAWLIADEVSKTSCPLRQYIIADPQPPQFSETSLNPAYHAYAFTAPTGLSSRWPSVGDWKATVFGDIDGYEYMNPQYFTLQPYEDGSIRLASGIIEPADQKLGVGKIASGSDGIAMYYQAIPADRNFTLSTDVTISRIDANNQASFGLMVRDDIYLDTIIQDTLGDYVAAGPLMLASSEPWNCFARKNGALSQGSPLKRNYQAGDSLHLEIRKTSDGYTCTFGDNPPVSAGFDFPLTSRDSGYVYAGLFAARSVDVMFWNVELTLE
ncbi:MAG: GDSL-type esterase/lipase family protein [Lachnospiraceae bacterium]|nr:GDSL-type esterase/lipase family protein [Lachnospiraceae bacterium]